MTMELAMLEKKAEEQDFLRKIQSYIVNFSGMGSGKMYTPQQLQPIPLIDNQDITFPIRSLKEALSLLKEFE